MGVAVQHVVAAPGAKRSDARKIVETAAAHDVRPQDGAGGRVVAEYEGAAGIVVLEVAAAHEGTVGVFKKLHQVFSVEAIALKINTVLFEHFAAETEFGEQYPLVFHAAQPEIAVAGREESIAALCIEGAEKSAGRLCGEERREYDTEGNKKKTAHRRRILRMNNLD